MDTLILEKTIAALKRNHFDVFLAGTPSEAKNYFSGKSFLPCKLKLSPGAILKP